MCYRMKYAISIVFLSSNCFYLHIGTASSAVAPVIAVIVTLW